MDLNEVLAKIQENPNFHRAGMVLIHYGLVRSYDLKGRDVGSLEVEVHADRAEEIRAEMLRRPGIVDIVVEFNSGRLKVGDPIMLAAVAGGTRPEVFPVLKDLVDRLKREGVEKVENLA